MLATTYLNGQSTIGFDHDGRAHGETYCMAFHRLREDGQQFLLTMAVRYLDQFARVEGRWSISHRRLAFDWTDRHASSS